MIRRLAPSLPPFFSARPSHMLRRSSSGSPLAICRIPTKSSWSWRMPKSLAPPSNPTPPTNTGRRDTLCATRLRLRNVSASVSSAGSRCRARRWRGQPTWHLDRRCPRFPPSSNRGSTRSCWRANTSMSFASAGSRCLRSRNRLMQAATPAQAKQQLQWWW